MNAEALLKHYERIADAPDAVGRLRRFVLDLAVRGKLVGQDSAEESGAKLLISVSQMTGRSASAAVGPKPFELPSGWEWSTVGQVTTKTGSGSTPRGGKEVYQPEGIPFLRSQNVHDDGLRLDDVVFIDAKTHERMSSTAVESGDLLLNITGGSIGRCCLLERDDFEANISQHVAIIRLAFREIGPYAHTVIRSPYFQAFVADEQTGAGRGGLPKNRMDRILIPFPPLAEQHRIVAKVYELMALCDRLEAARAEREATRDRLAAASLARLNTPDPDAESFKAHTRFAISTALPALTTRADQIRHLRKTILNLAVRGALVVQVSFEESASTLLKAIQGSDTKIKPSRKWKAQALDLEPESAAPYQLPPAWVWARFSEIASVESNLVDPRGYKSYPHIAPDNIESGTGKLLPFESVESSGVFSSKHYFTKGCLLYSKIRPALAKVVSVDFDGLCSADMYPIRPLIDRGYLQLFMLADIFVRQAVSEDNRVAMPKINQESLSKIAVAVPPLAEQYRIVTKANELMQLCDQLEAGLESGANTRRRLLDALLHEAFSPAKEIEEAA